ncbi:MAG: YggS family pyridoxal phosphate-dependent enzyme [Kiritimatiellae bacterium]|nr:YggS family pyridoxal phosphate-dependent enzyme [Kiritimatiellia bacterium]MCO5061980.1 YggS family pyridoxal phosphate-dependent enzyme [Kiritimatiellia bacterium]
MSDSVADRLSAIEERILAACARAGRSRDEVELIAVSKTQPPAAVAEVAALGLRIFGENKVQEARAKIPECPSQLSWHLIGHLQSNKAKWAVELFDVIHSVDSEKLARVLDAAADAAGRTVRILLEVNVSGEGSKFGLKPEEVAGVLAVANACPRLVVEGLMTMAPLAPEAEKARPYFRKLRELRDSLARETGTPLEHLSMGMSGDFEVAIEEGATRVRIGTLLFGDRKARKAE